MIHENVKFTPNIFYIDPVLIVFKFTMSTNGLIPKHNWKQTNPDYKAHPHNRYHNIISQSKYSFQPKNHKQGQENENDDLEDVPHPEILVTGCPSVTPGIFWKISRILRCLQIYLSFHFLYNNNKIIFFLQNFWGFGKWLNSQLKNEKHYF